MSGGEKPQRAGRVLVAEADGVIRHKLTSLLRGLDRVATVREVPDPAQCLVAARQADLVLLDVDAPGAGVETARRLAAWDDPPAVVALARANEPELARTALEAGALSFVLKSSPPDLVADIVNGALEGRGLVARDVVRPVLDRFAALLESAHRRDRAVIASLAAAVEAKDVVTSTHLRAVSRLALELAELVDPELASSEAFLFGCLLHDVGKIGVPEQILGKPGPLDAEEWAVMRRHPQTGARVIRPLGLDDMVCDVVLHHHERWDGTGYPNGLGEDEIPLPARIFTVCDAFDAMTADRPYREAIPSGVAFERIRIEAGRQFDPEIVSHLERGVAAGRVALDGPIPPAPTPPQWRRITGGGPSPTLN